MEIDKNNKKIIIPADEDDNETEFNFDSIKLKESTLDFENYLTKHSFFKASHIVTAKMNEKKLKLAQLLIIMYEICNDLNERMFIPISQDNFATTSQMFSYEYLDSTIKTIISLSKAEQKQHVASIIKNQYMLFSKWYDSIGFVGDKTQARNLLFRRGCQKMHQLGLDELCTELIGFKRYKKQLMSIEQLNEIRANKLIAKQEREKLGVKRLSKKEKREIRKLKS